jgi:L-seryl-tRNA(Ser) seleniumtransferase
MSKRSRRTRRHVTLTLNRREFLNASRAAAFAGVVGLQAPPAARGMTPAAPHGKEIGPTEEQYRDNIYTRLLGVRPHLPAHEHISRLSGSRMPPEVTRAMAEANEFFVDMHELIEAAGKHCADAVGAEAALITSGAFSAMVLGAAACLTGTDQEKIEALPQVSWPKRECLIQKIHRFDYDRAYRAAGMTIVEAETREQFVNAISEKTAMIAAISAVEHQVEFGPPIPKHRAHDPGPETMLPSELVRVGKKAGVPVLVDFASDIPPDENLTKFVKMGADLVVLSGGKALRGPQSAGILAGRKDLIDAASLNAFPNANIGRGMKVGKEEVIGLVVALDRYLSLDMKAIEESWTAKAQYIADQLKDLPGVRAVVAANTAGYTDVDLSWDERIIPFTEQQLKAKLKQGDPPLIYDGTTVRTRCLWQGEEVLVARRLKEVFLSAVAHG